MRTFRFLSLFLILLSSFSHANSLCNSEKSMVVNIFAHGLAACDRQAIPYEKFLEIPFESFNFPDAQEGIFNRKMTALGQKADMDTAQAFYEGFKGIKKHKFGLSRGAATTLNCAAEYGTEDTIALTVESPFADLCHVVGRLLERVIGKAAYFPGLARFFHLFAPLVYQQYSRKGIQPIEVVHKIPTDMPILLICSKEDPLIPWWSTMALYKRLRETGHEHAYILLLDRGKHANIIFGPDSEKYVNVFHAFSRRYGLPFDSELAQKGETLLAICQPTIDDVSLMISGR